MKIYLLLIVRGIVSHDSGLIQLSKAMENS